MLVRFNANVLGYKEGDIVDLDPDTDGLADAIAGGYAADATGFVPTAAPTTADGILLSMRQSLAPRVTEKFDASITLTGAGIAAWVDSDPLGTSAARPLDVVIANCTVGQWVAVGLDVFSASDPDGVYLNMRPIVAGVPSGNHLTSHQPASAFIGPAGWLLNANLATTVSTVWPYLIKAGDLEPDGTLRMRLAHCAANAVTRSLFAISGFGVHLEGRGPFGARPSS